MSLGNMLRKVTFVAAAVLALAYLQAHARAAAAEVTVSVISDAAPRPAAKHGLGKIMAALEAKGVEAERVDGVSSSGPA